MHSDTLHVRVQNLEQKIIQLLKQHQDQQKMIQQLREDNELLTQQVTDGGGAVHNFKNDLNMRTIAKKEIQIKNWGTSIDSYINDIDKSIAYLEQLQ